jgi:hypothetical protein
MRRARWAIPLADVGALGRARRRALSIHVAVLAALGLIVAALAVVTRSAVSAPAHHRTTAATLVVLDISGSIGAPASHTIVHTLRAVAGQRGHAGLLLFSDDTEEALPPTAPAHELLRYVRLFRQPRKTPVFANPWTGSFSAGTQIGAGLAAARAAVVHAGLRSARVILVSDLDDSQQDVPRMRRELLAYARDPALRLRVAVVPGYNRRTAGVYRRILGSQALAIGGPPAEAFGASGISGSRRFPYTAAVLAVAAALVLAVHELLNAPLAWREART